ncbi:MAG: hypothetical protein AAFZ15_32140 [Bacteroidota bacterium]
MKNLSDKFDRLPQEFDREAIWEGIKKPKRQSNYSFYLWGIFLCISSAALFFLFNHSNNIIPKHEEPSTTKQVKAPEIKTLFKAQEEEQNALVESSSPQKSDDAPAVVPSGRTNKKSGAEKNAIAGTSPGETGIDLFEKITRAEPQDKANHPKAHPGTFLSKDTEYEIEALPSLSIYLNSSEEKTWSIQNEKITVERKGTRQSLAFRATIGTHFSDFSSSGKEEPALRNDLEKPQLDFGLSFRYEYILRQNFMLSASAGYHLYKDKIATAQIRKSGNQFERVDYKLYNHYHVFSGQVELGKRFYQRAFFWDVQGGVGLKFHQVSELNYFVSEKELASMEQVKNAYQNSADVFFTTQAAIGKHFGNRYFIRTGSQINAGIDLTSPQAVNRHRIIPINIFVELGMRF